MTTDPQVSEFFTAGGTLPPDAPSYVQRPTDDELFRLVTAGEFCYVLTPRQMGKSSLMIRTAQRLSKEGVKSAIVDLTQIGTVQSEDQWYKGILTQIARRLRLTIDPVSWWEQRKDIPSIQKFIEFFEYTLSELKEPVVIFMDEIDTTLKLDFRDNFFAGIRALFNARAENSDLQRITFVLLGVASPSDLIKDRNRTPFNIGQEISLSAFSRENARMLEKGLEEVYPKVGRKILDRIFYWTSGHPYLTQKICQTIVENHLSEYSDYEVDKLVEKLFITEEARRETNLQFVRDNILSYPERKVILALYKKLLRGTEVHENKNSLAQNHLKLSGLAVADNGRLIVSNRIYRKVFDLRWVNQNIPQSWNRVGTISFAATIMILFTVFAYVAIHDYLIDREVKSNQSSFYSANTSWERLSSLANIFQAKGILRNTDTVLQGRELFFSLSKNEQLELFSDPTVQGLIDSQDLTTVIKDLYTTFADLDRSGDSNSLLVAIYNCLENVTSTEAVDLRNEIGFWLKARGELEDNPNYGTLSNYNQAIMLNSENPATLYERARFRISIGDYEKALEDLHTLISITKQTNQNSEVLSNTTPINWTHVASTAQIQANTTVTVSPAFSPTVISTTQTPSLLSSSTPLFATRIPLSTSAVAATMPSSNPGVTTVGLPGYKSNFYTDITITSAIRSLLVGNRQIQEKFYANQNIYPNFINSGLIPTLESSALTTNTPVPPLSSLETTIPKTNTPPSEILPEPWTISIDPSCGGDPEIYTLRTDGSDLVRLTNNSVADVDSAISYDGKRIAFTSEREGDREIYTMNIDGTNVQRLTYSPDWDGNPAWSPDSKQIAFTSWRGGYSDIYVMRDNGSDVRRLTFNPSSDDWMPSWSPDGEQIAYASWVTDTISEIFVINSDGGQPSQLTHLEGRSFNPRWSPDGKRIMFGEEKFGSVYLINPDGNNLKRLRSFFSIFANPWSPDSQRIVFSFLGGQGIYIMNADGSETKLILRTNLLNC